MIGERNSRDNGEHERVSVSMRSRVRALDECVKRNGEKRYNEQHE